MWKKFWRRKAVWYDELKGEWDIHSAGDCNRHIGRHIDGFDEVHGGYGEGHLMRFMEGMVKVIWWGSWRVWWRSFDEVHGGHDEGHLMRFMEGMVKVIWWGSWRVWWRSFDEVHGGYGEGHLMRFMEGMVKVIWWGSWRVWWRSFDEVHGEHGVGQRNLEGRMLLEICLEKELCVSYTWFTRERKRGRWHSEWVKMRQKLTLCW